MGKKKNPERWNVLMAEALGVDLHKGGLVRLDMVLDSLGCIAIAGAINNGRAFILRRCQRPDLPYTHLVSWPGVALFACQVEQVD